MRTKSSPRHFHRKLAAHFKVAQSEGQRIAIFERAPNRILVDSRDIENTHATVINLLRLITR